MDPHSRSSIRSSNSSSNNSSSNNNSQTPQVPRRLFPAPEDLLHSVRLPPRPRLRCQTRPLLEMKSPRHPRRSYQSKRFVVIKIIFFCKIWLNGIFLPLQEGDESDDAVPVCYVCGERAGKHNYYGGQVLLEYFLRFLLF